MSSSDHQRSPENRGRWWLVLHAAVVALHPLSVFLLPWRAGARDARMAIGLLHKDPNRRRRLLCAACYLSVGASKVGMVTGLTILLAIIITSVFRLGVNANAGWFGQALMAIVSASAIAVVSMLILANTALLFAAAVRQKLWIDEWVDPETALDGRWPPVSAGGGSRNIAGVLGVVPSTMIPLITLQLVVEKPATLAQVAVTMSGIVPAVWIAKRVVAHTPAECYPETPVLTSESTHED